MACPRCETLPLDAETRGTLLLTAPVVELLDILRDFLRREAIHWSDEKRVLRLEDVNLLDFLLRVQASASFNSLELEAISALLLAPDETLDFHAFTRARTLAGWLGLLGARDLLEVLEARRLTAWFQPILTRDGQLYGYEALLRGARADGSLLFPDAIFGPAHANDLLFQVDRQAREAALRAAAERQLQGHLFINFIPTAIYDPAHCLKSTVSWAKKLGFDPKRIVFEVVETEKVGDINHLKHILDFYRNAGFRVALDDVGSGYASLNLLALLRPDIIKVDMELVRGIHADPGRQSVLRALAGIARELGIQLLAEGIETREELDYLRAAGADLLQGYLFARPAAEPPIPDQGVFGDA
ncbi:MAG: EAL domain-containing protein [Chromatiaceae bacterium]|nr:EAL domain-containing protein [Chromatiaceae bacterium]